MAEKLEKSLQTLEKKLCGRQLLVIATRIPPLVTFALQNNHMQPTLLGIKSARLGNYKRACSTLFFDVFRLQNHYKVHHISYVTLGIDVMLAIVA